VQKEDEGVLAVGAIFVGEMSDGGFDTAVSRACKPFS
jgi:hypothetical protein